MFLYFTIPTQQAKEKPKWLFNLGRAISTGFCRIAKMELTLPTAIFIAVGQQRFFSLKARKETCFFLNLVLCLTLLSNLEKQESIILWLINNNGCVNKLKLKGMFI